MKYLFFLPLCLLLSYSGKAQTIDTAAAKTFTFDELLSMLNQPPGQKALDSTLSKHGNVFEKKGAVFSPSVNGAVKNAFSLRYRRGKYLFSLSYYNNVMYLVTYFLSSGSQVDALVARAKEKNVFFMKMPRSATGLYGEYNDTGIAVFNAEYKVFNLSNITICNANNLMQF